MSSLLPGKIVKAFIYIYSLTVTATLISLDTSTFRLLLRAIVTREVIAAALVEETPPTSPANRKDT